MKELFSGLFVCLVSFLWSKVVNHPQRPLLLAMERAKLALAAPPSKQPVFVYPGTLRWQISLIPKDEGSDTASLHVVSALAGNRVGDLSSPALPVSVIAVARRFQQKWPFAVVETASETIMELDADSMRSLDRFGHVRAQTLVVKVPEANRKELGQLATEVLDGLVDADETTPDAAASTLITKIGKHAHVALLE